MDASRLRSAIVNRDQHQYVFRTGFSVFDENLKIPVLVEDSRVEQLEFRLVLVTAEVFLDESCVGKCVVSLGMALRQVRCMQDDYPRCSSALCYVAGTATRWNRIP